MIYSKQKDTRLINQLGLELFFTILVSSLIFAGIIFYALGDSNSDYLEFLFDNPFIFVMVCLGPSLLIAGLLIIKRWTNYIVGFDFDKEKEELVLAYKTLFSKDSQIIKIPFHNIKYKAFILNSSFSEPEKGINILWNKKKYMFNQSHFLWESEIRKIKHFRKELKIL
ncbi:MAG: hypothetical protein ACPG6V_10335 [Flavobacteriales bacterium]